jgi:hypothetical protein
MKAATLQRSIMRGRFVVIYHDPEWGLRSSAPLSHHEAVAVCRRFNHQLRRRMQTQRTIQDGPSC